MKFADLRKIWFNISDKLRFLLIGGFNFSVSYLIYIFAILIFGKSMYQLSLVLSWIISSIISFTTQRFFVFPIRGSLIRQYLKCCLTWVFSYFINAIMLEFLVKNGTNVYLAQIIAVSLSAIFTYTMFKFFAFKKKSD